VSREREEAAKAKDALDLRKERVVAQLEKERDDLVRALDALDDRLVGTEGASDARLDELRDRRAAAANRLATLEDTIASGRVLSPEEERALRELEDRLDSLETEAEYIAAAHSDLTSPRAGSGDGDTASASRAGVAGSSTGSSSRVARLASAEARAAVAVALERVVAAQTREREKDAKAAELEMQLSDAQSAIEEMENATRMREMDYDRRVTELRREHSKKEAYLMKLSERVAAQVDALERAGGPTAAAATTTTEARASPDAFAGTALASPARAVANAGSENDELRDRRVAVLTEEAREAKSQNKQLKRRVKALLAEREELEAAAAKLEERLESSSRAAQTLQEQVERLSLDRRAVAAETTNYRRGEAATAFLNSHSNSNSPSPSLSPSLPERPRLPATPAGGADGAVRVSRSRVRAVSLAEVEAARLNKMTAAGYPGAGGTAAGRRVAAAIGKKKPTSARDGTSPVSSMNGGRGFAGY
jgi:chromosome segregation ATPase